MVNDVVHRTLIEEEKRRTEELENTVHKTAVWPIFQPIPGVGPRIAAGIMAYIGDIRRFTVPPNFDGANTVEEKQKRKNKALEKGAAKLMKFCGVHVMPDGRFPRRRTGEVANWSPAVRQSLYLLGDQFNRRPDSD